MLTTSFQINDSAIQKHVPSDKPFGRSAQLMEKERKLPIVTSF